MALPRAQRKDLARAHRDALGRAVAAEEIARRLLAASHERATLELVAAAADTRSPREQRRAVHAALRSGAALVAVEASVATRQGRAHARELARGQVAAELTRVRVELARRPELGFRADEVPTAKPAEDVADQDAFESDRAARAVAQRWAAVAAAAVLRWRRAGADPGRARELGAFVTSAVTGTVSRAAAWLSFDAYADEQRGSWRATLGQERERSPAARGPYRTPGGKPDRRLPGTRASVPLPGPRGPDSGERQLPYGWAAGLFDVWAATLDRVTCAFCWDKDGSMVPQGRDWPGAGRPPVHPFCRCVPVTLFVPEALSRRMPGVQIDYGELKADIREYFQTARLEGGRRHAPDYVTAALGPSTTSPQVLTGILRQPRAHYRVDRRAGRQISVAAPGAGLGWATGR